MTDIIYLLYFADVVEELKSLSISILIFCSVALIVHMFIVIPDGRKFLTKVQYRVAVSLIPVCILVLIFMPSKNIVYSLAAIKAGEVAAGTEAGELGSEANKALIKGLKEYNAAKSSN